MKLFLVAVVIACFGQLPVSDGKIRIFKKIFPQDLTIKYVTTQDGRLSYVRCIDHKSVNNCKIEQLRVPYQNATYSCELSLAKDETLIDSVFRPFGKDKYIIIQTFPQEIVIYTVHLAECRISQGLRLPELKNPGYHGSIGHQLNRYHSLIVAYENRFDVFFHDVDRCGNKECRLTIDANGKLIGEPDGYMDYQKIDNFIDAILPIAAQSPEKGYVYVVNDVHGRDLNLSFIQPNESKKNFARFTNTLAVRTYANNELIGVCVFFSSESNVTCTQYDSLGNIKLQINLAETVKFTLPFYLYNLPESGLLVFVMATKSIKEKENYNEVYVLKINAAGEVVGKIDIKGLDYTKKWTPVVYQWMTHVWKDEDSREYCATFMTTDPAGLNVTVNCFDDTDFVN